SRKIVRPYFGSSARGGRVERPHPPICCRAALLLAEQLPSLDDQDVVFTAPLDADWGTAARDSDWLRRHDPVDPAAVLPVPAADVHALEDRLVAVGVAQNQYGSPDHVPRLDTHHGLFAMGTLELPATNYPIPRRP